MPFLLSVTGAPVAVMPLTTSSTVRVLSRLFRTATEPATCGAACDVPLIDMPAAVIIDPGASRVRKDALFEKQVTLSAAVVLSVQVEAQLELRHQLREPTFESYTAPAETAAGAHAGAPSALV